MPRRVSLPGANELFRPTVGSNEPQSVEVSQQSKAHRARKTSQDATSCGKHAGSGRVSHEWRTRPLPACFPQEVAS